MFMQKLKAHEISHQRVKLAFFVAASLVCFYLVWMVYRPFLLLVASAAVAAIVLAPFHLWFSRRIGGHDRFCAFIATLLGIVMLGIPLVIGAVLLIRELSAIGRPDMQIFDNPIFKYLPADVMSLIKSIDIQTFMDKIYGYLASNISEILASTSRFALMTLLFFVTAYYLLAEREMIYHKILAMSPLSDKIDNALIRRLTHTVRSVVLGSVLVGAVQGVLATIGFLIFGLPNALVWGVLTLLAAQIPMIGTGIVTLPAAAFLALSGHSSSAIGLAIWGVLLVGTIDNYLKPKLVEGKTDMHPLLILLAMIGGIEAFGAVGIVLGPAVLAAALAFLKMYESGILSGSLKL